MSNLLTATQVAERALRAIGEFPVTESAPDGEMLREALSWLDMIMAEKAGTSRMFSSVTGNLSVTIVNGTSSYDLDTALGADLPIDRVQFPVEVWLEDAAGNRSDITIATRNTFEKVANDDDTGPPEMIHIDRTPTPVLRIYPTPATTDTSVYTLKLVLQKYAPNVAPGGVTGTQVTATLTGFRAAWMRWLVNKLSSDIASGPIRKLPQASIDNFERKATASERALEAFENREHDTEPPVCEPYGM